MKETEPEVIEEIKVVEENNDVNKEAEDKLNQENTLQKSIFMYEKIKKAMNERAQGLRVQVLRGDRPSYLGIKNAPSPRTLRKKAKTTV